jgi:D-xylose 1-dehydrogenase (NADP+, D-xylono-1,5-lactone-forming)
MQAKRLRWGVLGTARIADSLVRAFEMSASSELAAIASRDRALAESWAHERGVEQIFGSYDAMLSSDAVDAVYIPLPNALHKEWGVRAARSGKHVLCEKPLAISAAEVEEMAAAADESGVRMMEAFMYRFHPQTAAIRQLVAEGAVGEVKIIRTTFGFMLTRPQDVRWDAVLGGGALLDVGCYCVSLARLVAGAEPFAVTASADWAPSGVDRSLVGTLHFPGGVLATVDCSFQTGAVLQQWLTVSGTEGQLYVSQPFRIDEEAATIVIDRSEWPPDESQREHVPVPGAYEYHLMVEHFAGAVLNDRPLDYTLQESLANMRVLDALKAAAQTGRRVEIR